jgi:hypothetical protein
MQLLHMGAYHLAKILGITAVATERGHQDGDACLMLDDQLQHDLIEVGPMIPAIPAGDVNDVFLGLRVAVVAPIDMETGAIEMRKAGRKAQALRSSRGNEAVEFGHAIAIEGIEGAAQGIIIELLWCDTRRNQSVCGLMLEEPGHEIQGLINKSEPIEHHRFDGFADGEVPHLWVVVGRLIENGANAEFVEHASDQAEVVQDLATVCRLVRHNNLLCW